MIDRAGRRRRDVRRAPGRRTAAIACAATTLLVATPAIGQTGCSGATCSIEITMPVTDVIRITASTSSVDLGSPSLSDFTAGYLDVIGPAVTVVVKANRAFQVQVGGASATFGYGGSLANPLKPASDLKWATSQAGLSSAPNDMGSTMTLMNGSATAPVSTSMYFRTTWVITRDVPGTYSLQLSLTLSAP